MTLPAIMEPPVPPECDCRGLPFMPLDVTRLRESDFAALTTGDEFKAGLLLWCAAWTQVPASSLPDNDRVLARLAGVGLKEWAELREMALHGWIKCSDGKLYHLVIADKAREAFAKRRGQKQRADTRWAREKALKQSHGNEDEVPRDEIYNATASASAMQGTGTWTGTEESSPSGEARPKRKGRAPTAAHRIPLDWTISDADRAYATTHGIPEADVELLVEEFFNYWRGAGKLKSDWSATWRQNVAKTALRRKERGNGPGSGTDRGRDQHQERVGALLEGALEAVGRVQGRRGQQQP